MSAHAPHSALPRPCLRGCRRRRPAAAAAAARLPPPPPCHSPRVLPPPFHRLSPSYGGYVRNAAWVDNHFINVTNTGIQIETDYQSSGGCDASNCTEIRDIVFRNLTFDRLGCPGNFNCYAARPCVNVTFENVHANTSCAWSCRNVSSGSAVNVTPPGLAEACGF